MKGLNLGENLSPRPKGAAIGLRVTALIPFGNSILLGGNGGMTRGCPPKYPPIFPCRATIRSPKNRAGGWFGSAKAALLTTLL